MEQPRIERVLRLMRLMTGNVYFTVEELAERLGTTYRSIYRYIDTFREVGFAVEKLQSNVYRIVKMPSQFKDLSKLVYFSEEEARIVSNLIDSLDETNALKTNLHRKLAAIYDSECIREYTGSGNNAGNIQALGNAIRERKQVILKNYASASTGITRDRLVEPFGFTNNHIDIWAYDLESKKPLIFKIHRIEWVDILNKDWEFEDQHKKGFLDAFRMTTSKEPIHVKLEMTLKAKNLLSEEFPLAIPDIRQEEDKWIYEGLASNPVGVGRFCIGLADHVKVVDSPELEEYINTFIKNHFLTK